MPWSDGSPQFDWHIAADDRWHSPEREASVRQRRIDGTAVVETRVRIPEGDAVQRVYSVPDQGGLTVIEVENESSLPIAVAFTNGNLLSQRQPAAPIMGITLPEGSVAFPIGHHATLTVAIPHSDSARPEGLPGGLPAGLPTAAAVVRGWLSTVARAGRLVLPDRELNERIIATRCEVSLCGPPTLEDNPAAFLLALDQLVRMGERADPWLPHVANAVELAVKAVAKGAGPDWVLAAAVDGADRVLAAAGDARARRDLAALRQRLGQPQPLPRDEPAEPLLALAWVEQRIVALRDGQAQLLSCGLPASWRGINFEVFDLPTGGTGTMSFAIRWHGDRPAILWEQTPGADGPVVLTSPVLAPQWSTAEVSGEALWDKYNP